MALDENELKKLICDQIENAVRNRFDVVLRKLDSIQKSEDLLKTDLDEDRKGFAQMVTSQATVERLAKELLDILANNNTRIARKIGDKAQETMDTAIDAVAGAVQPAIEKVIKNIKKDDLPKIKRKGWWSRLWETLPHG